MQKRAAAPKPAKQTITKKLQRAKSQEEPIENDSEEEEESKRQQSDSDAGDEVRPDLLSTDMPITDFNISCLRKTFKQ